MRGFYAGKRDARQLCGGASTGAPGGAGRSVRSRVGFGSALAQLGVAAHDAVYIGGSTPRMHLTVLERP